MKSTFRRRLGSVLLVLPFAFSQEPVKSPTHSTEEVSAAIGKVSKETRPPSGAPAKLEATLEAVAKAWRRQGIRGAERESGSQSVKLERLRVHGVIHLVNQERRDEVSKALRRAWGEISTVEANRIYALIPVPALRRISLMAAVQFIYLDRPMQPADGPKEKVQ